MFLFSGLFLFAPIGLPGFGSAAVGKKISGVMAVFVRHLDYFLSFVAIIILLYLIVRIIKYFYKMNLRKTEILFYRLYSEILLLDKIKNSAKIGFSEKESIDLILKRINTWIFIHKVGKRNQERMVDGLNYIKDGKLDTKSSLALVNNWVQMSSWLISNL